MLFILNSDRFYQRVQHWVSRDEVSPSRSKKVFIQRWDRNLVFSFQFWLRYCTVLLQSWPFRFCSLFCNVSVCTNHSVHFFLCTPWDKAVTPLSSSFPTPIAYGLTFFSCHRRAVDWGRLADLLTAKSVCSHIIDVGTWAIEVQEF